MRLKRLMFFVMISVLIIISMPLTALASVTHPIPMTDFKNVKWYLAGDGENATSLNQGYSYDFVYVRYYGNNGSRKYIIYFSKNGVVKYDSFFKCYWSQGAMIPCVEVLVDNVGNDVNSFTYYPEYLGYSNSGEQAIGSLGTGNREFIIDKNDFSVEIVVNPKPPEPPDPPVDPIDPPDPPSSPINGVIASSLQVMSTKIVTDVGTIVNVGMIIMGIILAVLMVIRIIKKFAG